MAAEQILKDRVFIYKDVRVSLDEDLLTIENSALRRELDLGQCVPRTISLTSVGSDTEYADYDKNAGDFSFIGINLPGNLPDGVDCELGDIKVSVEPAGLYDGEHVEISLTVVEKVQQVRFVRVYYIYPELPVIASRTSIHSGVTPNVFWSWRDMLGNNPDVPKSFLESCGDSLELAEGFAPVKAVEFHGRTDYSNEQVIEHDLTGGAESVNGNLLFCDNGGSGLFFLQEAPPSRERRDYEKYDFRFDGRNVLSCCWGIAPGEIGHGLDELWSYRHVIGLYDDLSQSEMQVKKYLKRRFPLNPDKDYSITVNPWGCGNFPQSVNEQFLLDEVKACKMVGATHYQIDDGWQAGRALQELILKNRCVDESFWTVARKLLPDGFDNIVREAEKNDIELALWVAPSFNKEYRDWEYFADMLYGYYQRFGFRMFKLDAIKCRTREAEMNLEKMVHSLRERSNGDITFNFDTTNGQRPGYFMFLQYGNIFLENRYVCHKWGVGYHPESVLNNLWRIAKYIRPQVLQIEIPDHNAINYEFYENKGMTPPDVYAPEYWAGIALFANPLIWLAPSRLKPETAAAYKKIIDLHEQYRKAIFAGEIFAAGAEPDGRSVTGFHSHNDELKSGFIIVYRELEAPSRAEWRLAHVPEQVNIRKLYGTGEIKALTDGKLQIDMPAAGSFALFEY